MLKMTKPELYIALAAYVGVSVALVYLFLVTFGYANANEFGVFVPQVGGFHVEIEPYHLDK
jgi:hypothetical protein